MLHLQSLQTERVALAEGTQELVKENECSQQNTDELDKIRTETTNNSSDQEWEFRMKNCVKRYCCNQTEQLQKEKARLEVKVNPSEDIINDLKIRATNTYNMPAH